MFDKNIQELYEKREVEPTFSNIIKKDEIIKNEYNLNPKRYVYTLEYEEKPIKDIINKQNEYAKEIKNLDEEIEQLLGLEE
jgi:type I restriction-modification system DNA methylase subunit